MQARHMRKLGAAVITAAAIAWLMHACYGVFVNKEDQPAADRIVTALHAYKTAKGRYPPALDALVPDYLPALPTPRPFGTIGYSPIDGGRGCLVGYYTHRDYLEEYDCEAGRWSPVEYNDSRLVK